MSAVGFDCGTMFLVKSEVDEIEGEVGFSVERNVFLKAATTDDTESTLKENKWSYAKYEDEFYILGEDAIKLKNLLNVKTTTENQSIVLTKISDLRRPMKNGILNTGEEKLSVAMIQKLISNLIGKASKPNQNLCFCAPGDPVNNNLSVIFHKTILTSFLKSLGYNVECIPEAMAIIYSERPVAEDPNEPDGVAPFSGLAFAYGAGMSNIAFAYKKIPLINFSVCQSGDWIDEESAKVAGVDVSVITKFKEKHLNLNKIDMTDMKQAALDIFYQAMIENSLNHFAKKFNELENQIDTPLEIVVAGGTASVPGFIDKFKKVLSELSLPFKVKSVKLANDPLYAVANGCLIKALSNEKKAS